MHQRCDQVLIRDGRSDQRETRGQVKRLALLLEEGTVRRTRGHRWPLEAKGTRRLPPDSPQEPALLTPRFWDI